MQRCRTAALRPARGRRPLLFARTATTVAAILLSLSAAEANYLDPANAQHAALAQAIDARNDRAALAQIETQLAAHPSDGVMLYNAACLHARLGELDAAEARLREAIRAGFLRFSVMQRDPDLTPLHERPVYQALLRAREAADPVLTRRRLDDWRDSHDATRYRFEHDDDRRIDYATILTPEQFEQVRVPLESLHDALCGQLFPGGLRQRILIALATPLDARRHFPDPHVHGVYLHGKRLLIVNDVGRPLMHELVHALHHAQMDARGQQHPKWVQEGLACLFESAAVQSNGTLTIYDNERDAIAQSRIARGEAPGWPQFFALTDGAFESKPGEHYAIARSIMRFLHQRGMLAEWMHEYQHNFAQDASGARALERVFDDPLEVIEARWQAWALDSSPQEGPPIEMMPMLGALALELDPGSSSNAPQHEIEQVKISPEEQEAARLFDSLGESFASRHAPEAAALLERIITLDPDHADARYALGLAHYQRGDIDAALSERDALRTLDPSLASLLENLLRQAHK